MDGTQFTQLNLIGNTIKEKSYYQMTKLKQQEFHRAPLRTIISAYIRDSMPDTEPHLKPQLAESLTGLVLDIIEKFNKGQKEHVGQSIHDIDFEHEIYMELIDSFIYVKSKKWKKK